MPQWQLVPPQSLWSPPSPSRVTYVLRPLPSHPKQDPNPSIHIYAKQKAKVLCHFLVVDSCFSHNFIGMRPSASLGVCPSGHTQFSLIHWHPSSSLSLSLSHSNVTHFIKLCNARIIAQIRTKRHNRWQSRKRKRKRGKSANWKAYFVKKMIASFSSSSSSASNKVETMKMQKEFFEIILQTKSKSITNCDSFEINKYELLQWLKNCNCLVFFLLFTHFERRKGAWQSSKTNCHYINAFSQNFITLVVMKSDISLFIQTNIL